MYLINSLKDKSLIGGKAYNLFNMQMKNTPKLVVVPTVFFDDFLKNHAALDILKQEIKHILKDDVLYAVRSSAVDEDSDSHSFAGIHDSFLNIKKDNIVEHIFKVYDSANSQRALDYRRVNNLNTKDIKIAVVIQEMVDAEFSGVINTINPITNNPDEIVISITSGLGEDLVSGQKDGTTYFISGDKQKVVGEDIVSSKLLKKLIEFTDVIIDKTNRFQDIEFAVKNNKVYFLQTRDITTYKDINPHKRTMFIDNSNIIESYFGYVSPLTFSFIKDVYKEVYKATFKVGKVRDKIIDSLDYELSNMLYYHEGKVYYNMRSWYLTSSIFPFKKTNKYMEHMMGVKSSTKDFKRIKMNLVDILKLLFVFLSKVKNIEKLTNEFENNFKKIVLPYYGQELNLTNEQLKELFFDIERKIVPEFTIPIINDCAVMIYFGNLKEKVNRLNIDNKEDILNNAISSNGDVESAKSATELSKISEKIKNNPSVLNDFLSLSEDELFNKYHNHPSIIQEDAKNYIYQYGSRVADELKLETTTMIEEPKILYQYLKQSISDIEVNPSITKKIELPKSIIKKAQKARKFIQNRERLRLKRTYVYSVVRNIFLNFGKNFVQTGKITNINDIFYLTKTEIFNYDKYDDYKTIIKKRIQEAKIFNELETYDRIVFYDDKVLPILSSNNGGILEGLPSGAGIVKAKVKLMNSAKETLEKGRIILTKRTDPGWISLFPLASGLIVEHGSMLSHSFVVARELKLPAVVGVANATSIIKDNDTVLLDGIKGVIKIEN